MVRPSLEVSIDRNLIIRLFKHTAPTHAIYGGSLFLGYQLIVEFLRHHDHTNLRPMFVDHEIAMTIVGGFGAAATMGGAPKHFVVGALIGSLTLGPLLWWLKL